MKGMLFMEDGSVYIGSALGKAGTYVGEIVFNSSLSDYESILTNSFYKDQIINMTYPLIDSNELEKIDRDAGRENECDGEYAKGFIIKSVLSNSLERIGKEIIGNFLNKKGVIGICDIDTKAITGRIKSQGSMKCVITSEELTIGEMERLLIKPCEGKELVALCG